jgi:hypothetical protein
MHCDPKRRAAAVMNALSLIAAVLIATCAHRHRTGRHTCDHCASTQKQRREATMGIPYGMVQYGIGCRTKFYQTRACSSPCPHPPSAPHGCPRESEARHRHRAARTRPSRSFFCDPRSRFGGAERPRRHVERPPGCARGMIKLAFRAIPTYTRGAMPGSHPGMRQTHSIIAERFGRS